jgi:predicted amidohydrolase
VKLCLIPLKTKLRNPQVNLERLRNRLEEASHFRPDLICLPECTLTGYLYEQEDIRHFAEPARGPTMQKMAELARSFHVSLCYGFLESAAEGIYNSASLMDKNGDLLHTHRKVIEKRPFECGESFKGIDTEFGRLGIMICGDLFGEDAKKYFEDIHLVLAPMSRCFDGLSPDPERWQHEERKVYLSAAQALGIPTAIVNTFGDNAEDTSFGGALMIDRKGRLLAESSHGSDELLIWEMV